MDWLTFFSTDIQSLAWPATTIIALFVLKRQISELIRALGKRLLKAKGGGFEFTFGERVDQVEEILPAEQVKEIALTNAQLTETAQRIENISELSQLPPPYVVSLAWLKLEQAIREAVDNIPGSANSSYPTKRYQSSNNSESSETARRTLSISVSQLPMPFIIMMLPTA